MERFGCILTLRVFFKLLVLSCLVGGADVRMVYVAGCYRLFRRLQLPTVLSCRQLAGVRCRLTTIGRLLSAVRCRLSAVRCRVLWSADPFSAAGRLLLAVGYRLLVPVTCCTLPVRGARCCQEPPRHLMACSVLMWKRSLSVCAICFFCSFPICIYEGIVNRGNSSLSMYRHSSRSVMCILKEPFS